MQPFPDFNLFNVIESDLAQLRERRAQQRMARQDDTIRSSARMPLFARSFRQTATPGQATPSSACGD